MRLERICFLLENAGSNFSGSNVAEYIGYIIGI